MSEDMVLAALREVQAAVATTNGALQRAQIAHERTRAELEFARHGVEENARKLENRGPKIAQIERIERETADQARRLEELATRITKLEQAAATGRDGFSRLLAILGAVAAVAAVVVSVAT